MPTYAHITTPANVQTIRGGYKNQFLFAPVADFTLLKTPTVSPSAIGDSVKITEAHTFTGQKGFFKFQTKQKVATIKGTAVGEPGARMMEWTLEQTVLGDSASTQEQLETLLNADVIVLAKDANCLSNDAYIQLGDACTQPEISVEFDGKTTADGLKEYKITAKITGSKYHYTGAVTFAA